VTGLDAPTARAVALILKRRDHHGPVYYRRDGQRFIAGRLIKLDLTNPLMIQLGWADHVKALAQEGHASLSYEDYDAIDWDAEAARHYGYG
jgi:hypothetical protein